MKSANASISETTAVFLFGVDVEAMVKCCMPHPRTAEGTGLRWVRNEVLPGPHGIGAWWSSGSESLRRPPSEHRSETVLCEAGTHRSDNAAEGAGLRRDRFRRGIELGEGSIHGTVGEMAGIAGRSFREQHCGPGAIRRKKAPAAFETGFITDVKLESHQVLRLVMPLLIDRSLRAGSASLHGENCLVRPVTRLLEGSP